MWWILIKCDFDSGGGDQGMQVCGGTSTLRQPDVLYLLSHEHFIYSRHLLDRKVVKSKPGKLAVPK